MTAAFDGIRLHAKFALKPQLDLIGNGNGLPLVGRRSDQEKVAQSRVGGIEFKDAGVEGFLVFTSRGSDLYEGARLLLRWIVSCVGKFSNLHGRAGGRE